MAQISHLPFLRRLRAEPNQYILHHRRGRLVRGGPGLAYSFLPYSAAIAQLPVEDVETTFVLHERSADFQEIIVQVSLVYRIADPAAAARRTNFAISLKTGLWLEQPLERLAGLWAQWSRLPARGELSALPVVEAVRSGAALIRDALLASLRANPEVEALGLSLVDAQVVQVAPNAELEKALQTPAREAIQQKADEASFERRALAVEKERAIKQNELATEIELARRQEELIRRQAANAQLAAREEAATQLLTTEGAADRGRITAEAEARDTRVRAEAEADAKRALLETAQDHEARRVAVWKEAPSSVLLGLALHEFATKLDKIEHLHLTPDLLNDLLQRFAFERK